MRTYLILIFLILFAACSQKNPDKTEMPVVDIQKSESPQIASSTQVEEQKDQTEDLYDEIKDIFSGSWMDDYDVIDGEREVSWGTIPFSNSYYFIIDFQKDNRLIINGATEGGKKGFDRYIGQVLKIEEEDSGIYRFTYKNTITVINPDDEYEIVLRYNPKTTPWPFSDTEIICMKTPPK